jgi:hypothetical protein
MGHDDFNATIWCHGINCLLAEMRGDSLGPPRAWMISCPTPKFPRDIGRGGDSLEGSGEARLAFIGPAGPEPVPQPSGRAELALSLAPRPQGSGEAELVPRLSDSPGLMPGPPKQSWSFSAKAHVQAPTAL